MEKYYFSSNLRFLREKNNIEQLELAEKLGRKSASAVSEWEKGIRIPDVGTLDQISTLFNITINELMKVDLSKDENNRYYVNPETQRMAQEIYENPDLRILFDASRNLSPEDINMVTNMIKRFKGNEED